MNEWISMQDRYPHMSHVEYLVYANGHYIVRLEDWEDFEYEVGKVTHWMLLPEPPDEDKER